MEGQFTIYHFSIKLKLFSLSSQVLRNFELCKKNIAGPDDMPAHIKSSMFGCQLT